MWGCHYNSSSVVTLRTLCSRTCSIIFLSRVRLSIRGLSRYLCLEANTMPFVFPGWTTIRFWSHYFDTSFKSSWGNIGLIPYLPYVNKSSCHLQTLHSILVLSICSGRSLMKMLKIRGPRTEPCGTPHLTTPFVEQFHFKKKHCVLYYIYDFKKDTADEFCR